MIRGGKSYVSASPAFSNDAKRLLVCSGNTVSIISTSTGLQVASLEGHAAEVTTVVVVPASTPASRMLCYCWTAALDGTIRYWDFSVPELMKTIDVRLPIFSMVIPSLLSNPSESNKNDSFAYISTANVNPKRPSLRGQIQKCNLTKSKLVGGATLKETKRPELITISSSGRYFGILSKRKIFVWMVPETESAHLALKKITLHHTKDITVMAFHHTQSILAAGDATGRILLWRQFGGRTFSSGNEGEMMDLEEDRAGVRGGDDAESCSTWHWHSSEINVLTFSTDGAYLYSGGKEGVLVVWQIDTGKKKFLPRIGSPLLYFVDSPDPSLASISCADNQIHLLKMPSLEILKSISGIKLPCLYPEAVRNICGGYAFDSRAGIVAVPTEDYGIQFYSLLDDHGISEVTVCQRNHQPGDDVTVVVSLMALSSDSSVLSTVEVRLPEKGLGGLVSLKFWTEGSQSKRFSLSTVIYEPHRDSHISAITFRPNQLMAVTSSTGGDFKIWVCSGANQQKQESDKNLGWMCHAVGAYKKRPMTAAAFSADGSVLAVAAETIITLWDPDRNVLVAVIGETPTPIKTLTFLGQSEYVLSACGGSKPQLSVWNLSKLARFWSCSLHVEAVAYAEDSSTFAVLAILPESIIHLQEAGRDGIIVVFDVKYPAPVRTWSVRMAEGAGLAFIQAKPTEEDSRDGQSGHLLAFINGHHEYVLFDPFSEEVEERGVSAAKTPHSEETEKFGYASLYGELPDFNSKKYQTDTEIAAVQSERPWETIFSGSSHNLPPLTKLCATFLESLLEKRPVSVEQSS